MTDGDKGMKKIERLKTTPHRNYVTTVEVRESDLDELEQQRDEAINMVIKWASEWDRNFEPSALFEKTISYLEKLFPGQSWEQIKAAGK